MSRLGDESLPLILGAASVGAAAFLLDRSFEAPPRVPELLLVPPPSSWVFPVPSLGDRKPEVSDGWGSPRVNTDGSRRLHLGADIMFRRRHRGDLVEVYAPGTPNGTVGYFMPDDVPALAAGAGVVTFARWTSRGFTATVRHPEGWTTYYTHLAALTVKVGQPVTAGHHLGTIGADPQDRRHLKHLHFELWRDHARRGATNPAPYLLAWQRRTVERSVALRNRGAALVYRPIGSRGERYPDWIQALRGESGVYVIRERNKDGDPVVVYVGESHTGRLYETLTRHFQAWRRWKGFWRGQYTEGHDPGLTYPRDSVEVAARVLQSAEATDEEARLIRRLHPRDNLIGQPEEVPF